MAVLPSTQELASPFDPRVCLAADTIKPHKTIPMKWK
jgi:hypothetical protein